VGVITWVAAQTLAHWIPPDVRSNAFSRFIAAHDVIVEVRLPKRLAEQSLSLESGCLFKARSEENQVRCVECASDQNVEVVRHQAPSMKSK
jgi:hypothetical protein